MRIAVLSPVWFPVPPPGYGGIEWIVSLWPTGSSTQGHEVTLFASGDSHTRATLASVFPEAPSEWIGHTFWELRHAVSCLERAGDFDVISDHTGLLGLALGSMGPTPLAHTVHGPLTGVPGELYERIVGMRAARGTDLGLGQPAEAEARPTVGGDVPERARSSVYPFRPERGDYLLFLGRMTSDKGAHHAVAVAIESGVPLKLAGKCREPLERQYFDELVRPHLSSTIEYVGEVTHGEKVHLLQHARATLFPIEWDEPFGLVMIESMACGTPVIATRFGAVPEVIDDGVSGVIVDRWQDMAGALERADAIDPYAQRRAVEERFSPSAWSTTTSPPTTRRSGAGASAYRPVAIARSAECDRGHRPARDRALRGGAHDAADGAARGAHGRDPGDDGIPGDAHGRRPGPAARAARARGGGAARARNRDLHRLLRALDGGGPAT